MSRITTYGHVQSACYSGALVWHPISLTRLQMRMRLAQRLLRTGGWVTIWPSCAWAWRNPWGWASLVSRRLEICGSILSSAMSTTGHLSVSSGEASCAAAAGPSSMSIQDFYNAFTPGPVLRGVEPCGCPGPRNPRGPSPNTRILGVQVFYVYVLQSH